MDKQNELEERMKGGGQGGRGEGEGERRGRGGGGERREERRRGEGRGGGGERGGEMYIETHTSSSLSSSTMFSSRLAVLRCGLGELHVGYLRKTRLQL